MRKGICCLLSALVMTQCTIAQTRYIVQFRDKGSSPYSLATPLSYLSQRSIDRRSRYAIPIDSTDLPMTPRYVDSVRLSGTVTILNRSKWLNSVSIQTTDPGALSKIYSFPFVRSVAAIAARSFTGRSNKFLLEENQLAFSAGKEMGTGSDFYSYGSSFAQIHIHNGEFLHDIGLRGQGIVIGIPDGGFQNYLNATAFDSARANGQFLGVYDFVAHDSSVNEDDAHGTQCLSIIAANIPGKFVGSAPKAGFYLFRSENPATEYPIEEHNWVCAAERLDSAGGDLISSSLGYNTFDPPMDASSHVYADMDGNTTMAARGADLAAKKGILVLNCAGNEGSNSWHYIVTPADGDSVLAVGSVAESGIPSSFSSYGPSSDGQVKPDVASLGENVIVQFPNNVIAGGSGTSFSSPNMAGLAACLWQGFPEYNNMKIINALRQSANKADAPDDRVGYGIPDVKKATMNLLRDFATSTAVVSNCKTILGWTSKDVSSMKYEIERRLPTDTAFIKIGEQTGKGTVFGTRNYQFVDVLNDLPEGDITYRILQVIDTSSSGFMAGYIDTIQVTTNTPCSIHVDPVMLLPNPAKDQVAVRINMQSPVQNLTVRLFNNKGQLVEDLKRTKGPGAISIDIPLAHLAAGKYYVVVYDGGRILATKELIKLL
jgi:serine protease AprX